MRTVTTLIALFFVFQLSYSAEVDTIEVYSASMKKNIKTVIIQPTDKTSRQLPTVYLLHGYGGQYSDYVHRVPNLKKLVDQYGFIAVCPDGGYSSWYWDSSGDQDFKYETFIAKELVKYITETYPVYDDAGQRAVTGFSMGGHGALYLTLRNQDVFGAAASSAGGVDFRPFPDNWQIAERLGAYAENPEKWNKHTVTESLHLITPSSPALFIDCGRDDFFYEVNRKLHEKLTYLTIKHHYHTMPGRHTWDYVNQSILYQAAFFHEFFNQERVTTTNISR